MIGKKNGTRSGKIGEGFKRVETLVVTLGAKEENEREQRLQHTPHGGGWKGERMGSKREGEGNEESKEWGMGRKAAPADWVACR